jgi:hypothetical protein
MAELLAPFPLLLSYQGLQVVRKCAELQQWLLQLVDQWGRRSGIDRPEESTRGRNQFLHIV